MQWLIKVKFKERKSEWYVSKTKPEHPGEYFNANRSAAIVLDDDEKQTMMERLSRAFGSELEIWAVKA